MADAISDVIADATMMGDTNVVLPDKPLMHPMSLNVAGVAERPLDFVDVRRLAALSYKTSMREIASLAPSIEILIEYARAIVLIRAVAQSQWLKDRESVGGGGKEQIKVVAAARRRTKAERHHQRRHGRSYARSEGSDVPYNYNSLKNLIYATGAVLPHGVIPMTRPVALIVLAIALAPGIARQVSESIGGGEKTPPAQAVLD